MTKYWVMAGAYFGLYSFLLTVVPMLALQHGRTEAQASVLVAVMALSGFAGDATTSAFSARLGSGRVVIGGAVLAAAGLGGVVAAHGFVALLVATAVIGLGLPYMATPVLGGLAARAGAARQVRAQAVNAMVQRGGALVLSLSLGAVVANVALMLAVAAVAFIALAVGGVLMHRETNRRGFVEEGADPASGTVPSPTRLPTWRSALRAPEVQEGVLVNASTPLWILAGSSLFPLMLVARDQTQLLVPAITAREVVALLVAVAVMGVTSHRLLRRLWLGSMGIGALGFCLTAVFEHPVPVVACFSLHGVCIGLSIVLANALLHDGTTGENRLFAFAMGSMAARATGLAFPLLFGAALTDSAMAATAVTAVLAGALCLAVLGIAMVHARAGRRTDPEGSEA